MLINALIVGGPTIIMGSFTAHPICAASARVGQRPPARLAKVIMCKQHTGEISHAENHLCKQHTGENQMQRIICSNSTLEKNHMQKIIYEKIIYSAQRKGHLVDKAGNCNHVENCHHLCILSTQSLARNVCRVVMMKKCRKVEM